MGGLSFDTLPTTYGVPAGYHCPSDFITLSSGKVGMAYDCTKGDASVTFTYLSQV